MPAFPTLIWSKDQYQRGKRAAKYYLVTGVTDEDSASNAVQYQKGATHPLDSRLIAEQPDIAARPGLGVFEVRVEFVRLENSSPTSDSPTPLDEPYVWKWNPGISVEPVSHDVAGFPLVNAGLRPFEPNLTREINTLFLEVERNESSFDVLKAMEYQGSINSNTFTVRTGNNQSSTVQPGQCKLTSYAPLSFYNETTAYVRCRYIFEFRDYFPNVTAAAEYKSAFQWRVLNQGTDGFYTKDNAVVPGKILNPSGESVTSDVLLDRFGRPLNSDYTVEGETPQSNPNLPGGVEWDIQGSTVYLLYRRCLSKNFTGLNLG